MRHRAGQPDGAFSFALVLIPAYLFMLVIACCFLLLMNAASVHNAEEERATGDAGAPGPSASAALGRGSVC